MCNLEILEAFPCKFKCKLLVEPENQTFTIGTDYELTNCAQLYNWMAEVFDFNKGKFNKSTIVLKNEATTWVLEGCCPQEVDFSYDDLRVKFRYDQ